MATGAGRILQRQNLLFDNLWRVAALLFRPMERSSLTCRYDLFILVASHQSNGYTTIIATNKKTISWCCTASFSSFLLAQASSFSLLQLTDWLSTNFNWLVSLLWLQFSLRSGRCLIFRTAAWTFFFLFFSFFLSFYEDQIGLCAIGEFILSRQCSLRWVLKPKSTRDVMKERGRTPHLPHLPRSISPIRYWHLNVLASALSRSQIRLPSASFAFVLYTKHRRKIPRSRPDDVRTFLSRPPQFHGPIPAYIPLEIHDITQVYNS